MFRRSREKSDCSEAFILPVVEEERGSQQDEVSGEKKCWSGWCFVGWWV